MSDDEEQRFPAADWDTAFEAVSRVIRRFPTEQVDSDEAARRNALVWRGVMAALEATNPIQPYDHDYAGEPEFDVAPISVTLAAEHWWICPRCAAQLEHTPSYDQSIDGLALVATPDVYRCERCSYRYQD